jgi:polyhydroxyalkanoate synthesis regulator phasin
MPSKMPTHKVELNGTHDWMEFPHKVLLAYVGAFGVAGDEFAKLFELFVKRGERVEKDARKFVNREEKQVRKFATQVQKEQRATIRKAVKRVEAIT